MAGVTIELRSMRRITRFLIAMSLFSFLGCDKNNEFDPYWQFDKTKHYRPSLSKGEFFKLSGYDFGWYVLEPISKFVGGREHELEKGKCLSYGQKSLYYWWYLDAQVTNGGFVQFYYNGYAPYVQTIVKGLKHIGDKEMAALVEKADKIYQKNKKVVVKAQQEDLFGGDLYDKLDELSRLDDSYYEMNENTMSLIEAYVRNNPNEICLDEEGKEFDMSFTGRCKTYYANEKLKEEFDLKLGTITGEFKSFYENGNPKEVIQYSEGNQTGDRIEYYENGNPKYKVLTHSNNNSAIHSWYYDNGNPKKLETKFMDKDERKGAYQEWYENGQLAKTGTYISDYEREGEWLEYYQDGTNKVVAEFVDGKFRIINHWNEKGKQILTNGTGLYVNEFSIFKGDTTRNEHEYKDYKRHGIQKTFDNGVLTLYQEMENGVENGYTRSYYNNGNLKEETVYKDGKATTKKEFPKYEDPKVKTIIKSRLCSECYKDNEDYELPENEPTLLNKEKLESNIEGDVSMFKGYGDDYVINYSYVVFVDKKGKVKDFRFSSASNALIVDQVERNLEEFKYEAALKGNKTIESIHFVQHRFKLTE